MQPSIYQQGILDWLNNGNGNGACNAVAGAGKSTTLKMAALALQESGYTPNDIKIIVFGKQNSLDLIAKFGDQWKSSISTLHSAGWQLIKQFLNIRNARQTKITSSKYRYIAQDLGYIGQRGQSLGKLRSEHAIAKDRDFLRVIDLIRLTNSADHLALTPEQTIGAICSHFEIDTIYDYTTVAIAAREVLADGIKRAEERFIFDFTDQVWLPIHWRITAEPSFEPFKFVLVDECQDLNATQLELAIALAGQTGRLLFVGDPRQAIMGFAGADNNSYQTIVERTNATELPLSICYRCPSSHIELVQKLFPDIPIEAAENAYNGDIETLSKDEAEELLGDGDMVLCRKTAPLVSLCIQLIARGIAATVKGKDIGEQLKRDIEDIAAIPGFTYEEFPTYLSRYRQAKYERLNLLENGEQLIETLRDKLEAILTVYENRIEAKSIQDLGEYVDHLFSDGNSPITLSTVHRSKGLEGDRIYLIQPESMPLRWKGQLPWQFEQEKNLLYVALTRSKRSLFIVGQPTWFTTGELPLVESITDNEAIATNRDEASEAVEEMTDAIAETSPSTKEQLTVNVFSETMLWKDVKVLLQQ
jgi:superfamily I DNA/RNA helicase